MPRAWNVIFTAIAAVPTSLAAQGTPPSLPAFSRSLEELAARVSPSVVQIFTVSIGPAIGPAPTTSALLTQERRGGSGVIIDTAGYIVTNVHVVENARRLRVRLAAPLDSAPGGPPGRSTLAPRGPTLNATLVGIDRETDLALLKIDRTGLPALPLGNSDSLRPGQVVLAFGSPLGLENSVTLGIVSAIARQLEQESPMVYVQTDAPINPGNSGGALVDTQGRLVGINTLIFTQSGGNEGIGFAAPSNIVRAVVSQLRQNGRVRRGAIGVTAQSITPELARALALGQRWGAIIADVWPGSPAARAGVRIGDVVLTLDGKTIENARQFEVNLYGHRPGDVVSIVVLRGLVRTTLRVGVLERPDGASRFADMVTRERNLIPALGILAIDVDPSVVVQLPRLRISSGVLVAGRAADAPFWDEGLIPGDVIHTINGEDTPGLAALRTGLAKLKPGDAVALQIERDGRFLYVWLELE